MKALLQDTYGTSDVLRLDEIARPEPGPGEVLVRIAAASINAADWHIMRGEPRIARLMDRSMFGRKGPREPVRGRDFAGTIEVVGPGVTGWRVGDQVLGEDDATLAEFAVVPHACLARKPEALSFEDAAALPLAAGTADLCLTRGEVAAGHHVLVIGASGGVGTFAVQLAAVRGAIVTGVCRTRNIDLVTSLGAKEVIDYTRDDFTRTGTSYDVVVDLVGNRRLRDLRRIVAPGGRLVLSGGGNPGEGRFVGPIGLMAKGWALRTPPRPARADPHGHAGCGAAHRARRDGRARRDPRRDRPHLSARGRRRRAAAPRGRTRPRQDRRHDLSSGATGAQRGSS
ncbi:MAG: NAD(P)-dependent alcohol dehydrogenase [Propionibacteriales bacterium]|nr:NAD(P)-dependent alcohol dehydrogenase [Propionibacteriales bacterium]